ncbi:MAG: hypothetical protein ACLR3W_13945 [Faecalibacillus intestinalis]|uniref:hypothetical protein n=1 Tax=Faecalibacillus intestinalis TaxID=1982626 RepID=UPI00399384A8
MLPTIKVYEIDYDFIIKNYLDPKLWNKSWTVFVYRDFVFTLKMTHITVTTNTITFEVKLNKHWNSRHFDYNIENSNINFLKKSLKGTIKRLIGDYEESEIRSSDGYSILEQNLLEAENKLEEIANDFLDDEGVTNKEIRELYVENYVDNNSERWDKLDKYITSLKYTDCTDLYMIFAEATNDESLKDTVQRYLDDGETERIQRELEEYCEYVDSDKWLEDVKEELENI